MPEHPAPKSIARSLGEFFGHIVRGVRTDVTPPTRTIVRERIEEEERDTPEGKVVLRRTVIEEIEMERKKGT